MSQIDKKINLSNKIYPMFSGLSSDILFWAAINTLFLTIVKNFSAMQISSCITISSVIAICSQRFVCKIIKKIGNINSIRVGAILLLTATLLITFSKTYLFILIGQAIYEIAFLFKEMDNVMLRKNLKYQNRLQDYVKMQSKSSMVYAFVTMLISFISGFLFNKNQYLPMIISILFCINNVILSFFLYEAPIKDEEKIKSEEKTKKFVFPKMVILIFIIYGLSYGLIDLGQSNHKLLMQFHLSEYFTTEKVVLYLTMIISISRVIRVLGNWIFSHTYHKCKTNFLYLCGILFSISFLLAITASFVSIHVLQIGMMAMAFFILLGIRDPFQNYMKEFLLSSCSEKYHEKAIIQLTVSRKLGKIMMGFINTMILYQNSLTIVMFFLFLCSIGNLIMIYKIHLIKQPKEKLNLVLD